MVHAPNQPTRVRGFSLIEMLAVVLIFALMAMFVLPNFESVRSRALGHAAERIASRLELARQRTIVTGVPHRLWIDLDDDSYRRPPPIMDRSRRRQLSAGVARHRGGSLGSIGPRRLPGLGRLRGCDPVPRASPGDRAAVSSGPRPRGSRPALGLRPRHRRPRDSRGLDRARRRRDRLRQRRHHRPQRDRSRERSGPSHCPRRIPPGRRRSDPR